MLAWLRKHPEELECQLIPSCWHRGPCVAVHTPISPGRDAPRKGDRFVEGDEQLLIIRSRASRLSDNETNHFRRRWTTLREERCRVMYEDGVWDRRVEKNSINVRREID
ncbi:hypothetical protein QLX08_007313 [Tetragonisca angustula]|uniref:Uncharacterized protein n=1 Tax=Tetragonisca angustula TaxID=166442 RepID=A0AAW0ZQ26_9HYME